MKFHSPLLSLSTNNTNHRESASSVLSSNTVRPGDASPTPSASTISFGIEPCTPPPGFEDDHDQRWSEVVPPDAGLMFALKPGDDDDAMSFSTSPDLLLSPTPRPRHQDAPSEAYTNNRSQVLTLGTSTSVLGMGMGGSATPGTMQFFRENFPFEASAFFPSENNHNNNKHKDKDQRQFHTLPTRGTQTSSTMDGMDVYLRGSLLGQAHNANRYASCFADLDDQFSFDARTAFGKSHGQVQAWRREVQGGKTRTGGPVRDDVSDEGFFESERYQGMDVDNVDGLPSRFSMTTTSTSNFVTVEKDKDFDAATATWTTLEAPNTPGYSNLMFGPSNASAAASTTASEANRRRLQKLRPVPGPAAPMDVLSRPEYNHSPSKRLPFPRPPPQSASPSSSPSPFSSPVMRSKSPTPAKSAPTSPAVRARNLSSRSMPSLPKLKIARSLSSRKKRVPSDGETRSAGGSPAPGWVWIDVRDRDRGGARPNPPPLPVSIQPLAELSEDEDGDELGKRLPIWREHATTLGKHTHAQRPQPPLLHAHSAPVVPRR
ncbi:DJ-1 protein-PfpI domain-containing protein [Mycena chlorophos]|uniref:DJ-1 protein-PfpI domain-containing protein n=1 Tax=Mycena chlorophos TaxID=658473 RepID=A0A8H6SWG0_MYCCL|nr:DJ-1 protein-PfpI domain-containing protein [Mycena chlorophos]